MYLLCSCFFWKFILTSIIVTWIKEFYDMFIWITLYIVIFANALPSLIHAIFHLNILPTQKLSFYLFKVLSFSSSSQYFARLSFKSFVLIYGLYVVVKIGSFLCCSCILCWVWFLCLISVVIIPFPCILCQLICW